MATLAFAAAGAAIGSTVLPAGVTVLGATLSGAALGSQIGALAGSVVDQALFAPSGRSRAVEGPRLSDLKVTASTEGAAIPRVYGRARLGGQVIWATDFEEEVVTTTSEQGGSGGKGGGGGGGVARTTTTTTEYRYYANFAVALCEGEIGSIGRVWADGAELDLATVTHRVYPGSEEQQADSLIVARMGASEAPAYRGVAYVVFERLALAPFGNRVPQLSFEVHRPVDELRDLVRGVVLIPGAGEFVYAPAPVARQLGAGAAVAENVHTRQGGADLVVSLDQLEASLPAVRSVSLVTCWFGSDLRAAHCQIRPGVEIAEKTTTPLAWSVAGLARDEAHLVSQRDGRPAYGGTPSDASVVGAIAELRARGLAVTLTPFVLMDIAEGNALADPHGGSAQPAYPWRGRITVDPAPGRAGTPDKTAAAGAQIAALVGTAEAADFAISDGAVLYTGPGEWSYRRFILHHAVLAKLAGGVDAFVIGSELRGLSQVRDGAAHYPFVDALAALASDVKAVLGPATKVTYAADWSEYSGHRPEDGTGDVHFHLDPLWASSAIDAVGIDFYAPLADWRDGRSHADYLSGARAIYDRAYLTAALRGGEYFNWYYASDGDRQAQIRTPITDGAGKPWVFRAKDVRGWWENHHYDRPGGVESATPTAWVPQSKPVWLMEIGCPAVDKGANQPNVFVDPKSAESGLPYFSRGSRDDLVQRRLIEAIIVGLDPAHPGYLAGANPTSQVYGAPMIDLGRVFVYAWDARPYPAFPADEAAWGDAGNWRLGHWLNGRLAGAPLAEAVARLLEDWGFTEHDTRALAGTVPGFVVDRIMSTRDALQPLELAYFFDSLEADGRIAFRHRGTEPPALTVGDGDLVEPRDSDPLLTLTRAQETDLPAAAKITYLSSEGDYRQAVAESRRLTGASGRVAQAEVPVVLEAFQANAVVDAWLHEAWAARERAVLTLPPSALAVEPGDLIEIVAGGVARLVRVTAIGDHGAREIEALSIDPGVYGGLRAATRPALAPSPPLIGSPLVEFLDLPVIRGDEAPESGWIAAYQSPWPGGIAVYRSPEATGYALAAIVAAAATLGETLDALPAGPTGRIDRASRLSVRLEQGELASATRLQMLAGRNVAAVRGPQGTWEVLQFETARLVGPRTYELSGLLRGQAGTEDAMRQPPGAGARFVLIDGAITRLPLTLDDLRLDLAWKAGPSVRDIGDASYVTRTHAFQGRGLRPLSPVHVRGRRGATGDLEVSWIRRTRIGGDGWETVEVPLAEETERYEVDVLDGSAVRRTLQAAAPHATYSAADQIADFGSLPTSVAVRVRQVSAVHGAGTARDAVV